MKFADVAGKLLRGLLLLVVIIIAVFPFMWMLISSFKINREVSAMPFRFFPSVWVTTNYVTLLESGEIAHSMMTTFAGAVVITIATLIVNSLAGYGFARIDFPFKGLLWALVLSTMFIPGMAILVTSFIMVKDLGMIDTVYALIIPHVAQSGHIFFIRQFYLNYPMSLEEAAMIDGSTRFKNFFYIFLPGSGAIFVIVGIGAFLGYWNGYLWPIMTINSRKLYTVMQLLQYFRSERTNNDGVMMAAAVVTSFPPLLLFSIFQKQIIQGIKISGLK